MKKKQTKIRPKAPAVGVHRHCSQFWVIDTAISGNTVGTFQASGPFHSQARAEQWIKDTSASDWLEACGCLRSGAPEEWGSEHIIVQVVRSVKPVPPSSVEMTLMDTANSALSKPSSSK